VKILRTIIWVLAAAAFLIFAIYNWQAVELTLWQNLVLETKVPVLVLLAFALGFLPLYAYHLSVKWALARRVRTLENSLKHSAAVRQHEAEKTAAAAPAIAADPASDSTDPLTPDNSGIDGGAK
jgi:putative membrane protein